MNVSKPQPGDSIVAMGANPPYNMMHGMPRGMRFALYGSSIARHEGSNSNYGYFFRSRRFAEIYAEVRRDERFKAPAGRQYSSQRSVACRQAARNAVGVIR